MAKIGLIRYLAWVIIGCPQDTPIILARYAALAAVLDKIFNEGLGTPEHKLRAAMWLMGTEPPDPTEISGDKRKYKKATLDLRADMEVND